MGGAVDHAFLDQTVSNGCDALYLHAESLCNLPGALDGFAHVGERAQILFFAGCQAIESNTEEVGIQASYRLAGGLVDDLDVDGRGRREVPRLVAPLLEKVRIALGLAHDFIQCGVTESDTLILDRLL